MKSNKYKSLYSDFISYCKEIEDPRQPVKLSYPIDEVLFLVLCSVISGCEGWEEFHEFGKVNKKFFKKYLPYKNGIPSCSTIARVFGIISPAIFEEFFLDWFNNFLYDKYNKESIIAIDGKTVCGSKNKLKSALHILHAYATETGLLLGYKKTNERSNEITAIPELLDNLDIANSVITLDAMGCQRDICSKIKFKNADYVIGLKGNQGRLNNDLRLLLSELDELDIVESSDVCAGHVRVESRTAIATDDIDEIQKIHKWPGLRSVVMVKRNFYNKVLQEESKDNIDRYYITSLPPNALKLQHIIRKHWDVESTHWILDVSFKEDNIHISMDNAAENLFFIRRLSLNLLKMYQKTLDKKTSIKRLQKICIMDASTIGKILSVKTNYREYS